MDEVDTVPSPPDRVAITPRANWRRRVWISAILGALGLLAYSWPKPWATYTLPSGHKVTHVILGHFVVKNSDPVLRLRYETALPLSDSAALRREALELWPRFREKVERDGYNTAAFYAEAPPTGLCYRHQGICHYKGFGFLVRKNQDGRWYFADNGELLP